MGKKQNKPIIITLSVILLITVFLSIKGFNTSKPKTSTYSEANSSVIEKLIEQKKKQLAKPVLEEITALEADLKDSRGTAVAAIYQALSDKWKDNGSVAIAAFYLNKKAETDPNKSNWEQAANMLFGSLNEVQDSATAVYYYSSSQKAYEELLKQDPNNLQAKVNLAVCKVDYEQDVMGGVGLLKEVVEADDTYEQAHYILGLLSIRSTQYDKALKRFEKLVSLQPQNPEYHILLGNVLSTLGRTEEAIQHYETAKPLLNDEGAVERVNNIIKDIKRN